jgi:hypothetical protein
VRELLTRRDRQVHLVAHVTQRQRVERADRVLVEVESARLERVAEVRGLGGTEHRVGVEDQVDPVAEGLAQRLRSGDRLDDAPLRVPPGQAAVVERGERAEPERGETLLPVSPSSVRTRAMITAWSYPPPTLTGSVSIPVIFTCPPCPSVP